MVLLGLLQKPFTYLPPSIYKMVSISLIIFNNLIQVISLEIDAWLVLVAVKVVGKIRFSFGKIRFSFDKVRFSFDKVRFSFGKKKNLSVSSQKSE